MANDIDPNLTTLPLILHRPGNLAFLAAQHHGSGRFANIPFTVQPEGTSVDIGGERRRVLGFGQMLERAAVLTSAGHDVYLTHARYNAPFYIRDDSRVLGARLGDNVRDLAALFVDIDVGTKSDGTPHAYQTHSEALAALDTALAKAKLPSPSMAIDSGSGGAHAVLALDPPLPPEPWLDLARRFVAALKAGGLVADWQQSTMQIAAPRLPGTVNWKTGVARPVTITRLGGSPNALATLQRDTGQIVRALASFAPAAPGLAANGRPAGKVGSANGNFTAGLTDPVTPHDIAALFAVLPNNGIGYDKWIKIAFACWAVVYQSSDPDAERIVRDAFVAWSHSYPHARRGDRDWVDPEKTWRSARNPRDISDAIFVDLAKELNFWLPSRVAAPTIRAVATSGQIGAIAQPGVPADGGQLLLKRIHAHHRLALCRGRLEAERTVYRILLAEPSGNILPVLGKIVRFMLYHDAQEAPLIAFVDRLTGVGGAQFIAAVQSRIAANEARSVERLMSTEVLAALRPVWPPLISLDPAAEFQHEPEGDI